MRVGTAGDPLLVVAHHQHRPVGGSRQCVQPVELVGRDLTGGASGNHGVEERDGHTGQLDPLVARVPGLPVVRVVVTAHDMQLVYERRAVAGLERIPLLCPAVHRQVALGDDGVGVDLGDLASGATIHGVRIGSLAGCTALDGAFRAVVDATALDLTEVNIVDSGQAAQQLAMRARESGDLTAHERVGGRRLELLVAGHGDSVEQYDEVVGDRHDVHGITVVRRWAPLLSRNLLWKTS